MHGRSLVFMCYDLYGRALVLMVAMVTKLIYWYMGCGKDEDEGEYMGDHSGVMVTKLIPKMEARVSMRRNVWLVARVYWWLW
jgi:hypothetical protein